MTVPQYTWDDYERDFADRHLLHDVLSKWALESPDRLAVIEFDTGREVTYRQLNDVTSIWALRLLELGYRPGDYLASLLQENSGNVSQAARQAGMSRQGLHKLLKKHDLDAAEYRL